MINSNNMVNSTANNYEGRLENGVLAYVTQRLGIVIKHI